MYISTAWSRPRHYSIYPQKKRSYRWLILAITPVCLAGAWFVVPTHITANPSETLSKDSAQSVAVAKTQSANASTLPETSAASQEPLADSRYAQLQPLLENWIQKQPKSQQWSVVVQDTTSNANRAVVNERSTYYMASIYKLFLTLPLSKKYPFSSWQTTPISTSSGKQLLSDCVDLMITRSDNPCGEGVGEAVGWVSATKAARAQGMSDTSLSSSDLRSSARDIASYMTGLEQGKWFDSAAQKFLMNSLSHQQLRSGIPAGCSGCTVWNKTGDLNGVKHDAAIVHAGNAKFVLVVMSNGGSNTQIADVTRLVSNNLR